MTAPPLSETFRASAAKERKSLIEAYEEARAKAEALAREAAEAAAEADRCARAAREIGELLGLEDQVSLVEVGSELRGQRLRDVAMDVLRRHFKEGDIIHYKQWSDLVIAEGHRIGGKNPNATFLTQIATIEEVERVGRRTGLYRLRIVA